MNANVLVRTPHVFLLKIFWLSPCHLIPNIAVPEKVPSLQPAVRSSHLKIDGWIGRPNFQFPVAQASAACVVLDLWIVSFVDFFVNDNSANGQLLVWCQVVWIPRIPENERECYLGVPRFESQTTKRPKQTINHYLYLEPETSVYKWLFQLDDSKSLH